MGEKLTAEEVATLIRARKIAKAKGLGPDLDVKAICEAGGISRKTGYQWAEKLGQGPTEEEQRLGEELRQLEAENEELGQRYEQERFENEGRKLAWKIHGVDELLAAKKNTTTSRRRS
jgi:transposase